MKLTFKMFSVHNIEIYEVFVKNLKIKNKTEMKPNFNFVIGNIFQLSLNQGHLNTFDMRT